MMNKGKSCEYHNFSSLPVIKEIRRRWFSISSEKKRETDDHGGLRNPERHAEERRGYDAHVVAHQHVVRRFSDADVHGSRVKALR